MKRNTFAPLLPYENNAAEQRLQHVQHAVKQRHPFADDSVAQQVLRDIGMVETEIPCLEEGEVSSSETSASSSGSRRLRKSKRNRSGRRHLRRRSTAVDQALSTVDRDPQRRRVFGWFSKPDSHDRSGEPSPDAATITRLPGLSWKHFLRDLKIGEIEQVCLLSCSDQPAVLANAVSDDVFLS
ncbi:unnamed protein product [Phytophthora fragariaefolia]|uniref:Unnamed protein product n=1 Tax=Phytophthora fragariaefolia TaxID=1490495 RepID=A0A9W6XHG9_9STRA|nr:unnamed protein product [Phytophthora fragariaefolia]